MEAEKVAFRRIVASISDPDDFDSFSTFVWDEIDASASRKPRKYALSGTFDPIQ